MDLARSLKASSWRADLLSRFERRADGVRWVG
jgi:hypothetical protein